MSMANPVFSILIPVYNSADYLTACLESIRNQHFTDFEVILIDDGSRDESGRICDDFAHSDSRFIVHHVQNGGVSKARNLGISQSRGRYITFVDSDDIIEPDTLGAYMAAFSEDDCIDAVKCGYYREKPGVSCELVSSKEDYLFRDKSDLFKLLEGSRYYSFIWNVCIKRDKIGPVRFNEKINWLEDHIFCYQCYFNCDKVKVLSKPLYHYMIREGQTNLSNVKNPMVVLDAMNLEYDWKQRLNNGKYPDIERKSITDNYLYNLHLLVNLLYTTGRNMDTRKVFSETILKNKDFIYREERMFFNKSIPFVIRDIALRILFLCRKFKHK
ncbi:MAG: glycosyltransferase [Lactobacillus sp.]|nr:glycosyltransferase [Lactobacillus sp.]